MCRLFAVLAHEPVRVDRAFAALKRQALEHKDGWGVAVFYPGQEPRLEVSITPASTCTRFSQLGDELSTKSLLVHLRLASVGAVRTENAHPFFANGFAFMHNGTLREFATHREVIEAHIAPKWRAQLRGETDSERCFALFLTLLGEARGLEPMARAAAEVMKLCSQTCDANLADGALRSAMNFMVTDGSQMVATRRGRTLFHTSKPGSHFVASEALWPENEWLEVAEDSALLIDSSLQTRQVALSQLA